jgi:hypothetical protein
VADPSIIPLDGLPYLQVLTKGINYKKKVVPKTNLGVIFTQVFHSLDREADVNVMNKINLNFK